MNAVYAIYNVVGVCGERYGVSKNDHKSRGRSNSVVDGVDGKRRQ